MTRRAERSVAVLMGEEGVHADATRYLDRLGEALRVLARHVNAHSDAEETWRPRRERGAR